MMIFKHVRFEDAVSKWHEASSCTTSQLVGAERSLTGEATSHDAVMLGAAQYSVRAILSDTPPPTQQPVLVYVVRRSSTTGPAYALLHALAADIPAGSTVDLCYQTLADVTVSRFVERDRPDADSHLLAFCCLDESVAVHATCARYLADRSVLLSQIPDITDRHLSSQRIRYSPHMFDVIQLGMQRADKRHLYAISVMVQMCAASAYAGEFITRMPDTLVRCAEERDALSPPGCPCPCPCPCPYMTTTLSALIGVGVVLCGVRNRQLAAAHTVMSFYEQAYDAYESGALAGERGDGAQADSVLEFEVDITRGSELFCAISDCTKMRDYACPSDEPQQRCVMLRALQLFGPRSRALASLAAKAGPLRKHARGAAERDAALFTKQFCMAAAACGHVQESRIAQRTLYEWSQCVGGKSVSLMHHALRCGAAYMSDIRAAARQARQQSCSTGSRLPVCAERVRQITQSTGHHRTVGERVICKSGRWSSFVPPAQALGIMDTEMPGKVVAVLADPRRRCGHGEVYVAHNVSWLGLDPALSQVPSGAWSRRGTRHCDDAARHEHIVDVQSFHALYTVSTRHEDALAAERDDWQLLTAPKSAEHVFEVDYDMWHCLYVSAQLCVANYVVCRCSERSAELQQRALSYMSRRYEQIVRHMRSYCRRDAYAVHGDEVPEGHSKYTLDRRHMRKGMDVVLQDYADAVLRGADCEAVALFHDAARFASDVARAFREHAQPLQCGAEDIQWKVLPYRTLQSCGPRRRLPADELERVTRLCVQALRCVLPSCVMHLSFDSAAAKKTCVLAQGNCWSTTAAGRYPTRRVLVHSITSSALRAMTNGVSMLTADNRALCTREHEYVCQAMADWCLSDAPRQNLPEHRFIYLGSVDMHVMGIAVYIAAKALLQEEARGGRAPDAAPRRPSYGVVVADRCVAEKVSRAVRSVLHQFGRTAEHCGIALRITCFEDANESAAHLESSARCDEMLVSNVTVLGTSVDLNAGAELALAALLKQSPVVWLMLHQRAVSCDDGGLLVPTRKRPRDVTHKYSPDVQTGILDRFDLEWLRRLSRDTGGPLATAVCGTCDAQFLSRMHLYISSSTVRVRDALTDCI